MQVSLQYREDTSLKLRWQRFGIAGRKVSLLTRSLVIWVASIRLFMEFWRGPEVSVRRRSGGRDYR